MRTFLSLAIYGLLADASTKGLIDLHWLWQISLSFGFIIAVIRDFVEIDVFIATKHQLKAISKKLDNI